MLHVRWLGRVPYRDAWALQQGLFRSGATDHLLLLEHDPVITLGVRGTEDHIVAEPGSIGAELVHVDRGGDVTYHGPGQLVGYPILTLAGKRGGGMADTVAYVQQVEQLLIDALAELGLAGAGRLARHTGVWLDPDGPRARKIAAIGVRLTRARTMHGFALNVAPDLGHFAAIVPCGITDKGVTSLAAEGIDIGMREVVDVVTRLASQSWGAERGGSTRADVVWRHRPEDLAPFSRGAGPGDVPRPVRLLGRLAEAGVDGGLDIATRKPEWLRVKLDPGPEFRRVRDTLRALDLVTVCEEAGCPNMSECWNDGTATFMIAGERCTRACGFCLVDTRKPEPLDPDEPGRVAAAVEAMGLRHAVVTAVARDDLADGGAAHFAATVAAIRARTPGVRVETLISDCKGDEGALGLIFDARPDVLNHNLETVARLQRAVRPSAGYARSLAVLARAKAAGLTTKSSLIVGMGEHRHEVEEALADLAGVGCDIVTIGQYLRPTTNHLPIARWWEPEVFGEWKAMGERLGIGHVEAGPLTRSSYHAREAADAAARGSLAPVQTGT